MTRKRKAHHPGNVTKRGDSYRVRLCVGGVYHQFTIAGTETEAENFATAKYAELTRDAKRAAQGLPGPIRFGALVEEYVRFELPTRAAGTQESYRGSLAVLRAFFVDHLGDPLLREIRRAHAHTFLEWRRRQSTQYGRAVSAHTVAKDFRVLRRLFSYAVGKEHLDSNPCAHVKPAKADPRTPPILDPVQYEALLTACAHNPMLHLYTLVLAETGVRAVSEALALQWEDVDLAAGALTIRSTPGARNKSGRTRVVPMTRRLHEAMREHAARYRLSQRSPYVFTHLHSHRSASAGGHVKTFRGSFERAVKAAGLPAGFRAHDLRHRRVTTWLSESKSPVLVQLAMGHAAIGTTMGYAHLTAQHLRSLVDDPVPQSEKAAR